MHGLTDFQAKLARLDSALTGRTIEQAERMARSQHTSPEDMTGRGSLGQYYLSDGGYSRICYGWMTGHLFLTSNSLDRPRSNWAGCAELIADIEGDIRAYLEDEAP